MREEPKNTSNASIIRVHKSKNFTIISNEALFEKPPLSMNAKGLLCLMLALPDDWNYSIDGLVAICKEGRHSVKKTLKELKERGYLIIEKIAPNQTKTGRFEYIYHIYETKQEVKKQEVEIQPLEIQAIEIQAIENRPLYISTNNQITNNQITNNQINLLKTDEAVFKEIDLYNLYKEICIHFPIPGELTKERKQRASRRIKAHPLKSFWETVCQKAENSKFCRETSFFCFDWLIKNDLNSLKVFEGNYDDKRKSSNVAAFPKNDNADNNGKYSKCY